MNITKLRNTRSGFTLIELLVVIAIIAILAAILFPVFARARENARKTSCLSNLKQIGLGVIQYTQDYDERYPMRYYGGLPEGPGRQANSWRRQIFPYVKSTQLFQCPSNSSNNLLADDSRAAEMAILPVGAPVFNRSYAINGANTFNESLDTAGNNFNGNPPSEFANAESLSSIQSTAEVILVTEMTQGRAFTGDLGAVANWGNRDLVFPGHLGTVNFLFCDGHAKALKPSATASPRNLWTIQDDAAMRPGTYGANAINNWQILVNNS